MSQGVSESQMRAVKEAVREMLAARNWTGSATVASLQARMSLAGHNLSEEVLVKVGPPEHPGLPLLELQCICHCSIYCLPEPILVQDPNCPGAYPSQTYLAYRKTHTVRLNAMLVHQSSLRRLL